MTVSVIFPAVTGDDETRRLSNIHPVDVNKGIVIDDLSASVADEIDVLAEIAFVSVFPSVELERLDDAVSDELDDRGICGGKAQAFMFLSCLAVDEESAGMNMPLLNQHIDNGQSLTCYAEAFLLQPLNDRFFFHSPYSGIFPHFLF